MASLSDIARHAGISKSTVSLVLNNKPNVSQKMRVRVNRAIAELDPHFLDNKANRKKNPNVLLIHPLRMSSQQVFRELLQGIKSAIIEEAHGNLTLAVHDPPLKPDHATSALIHDPALRPDGVIIMAASEDDPIFLELSSEDLPCVLLAREHAPAGVSTVGMDNETGAKIAVEHFLEHRHQQIAFVGGNPAYDYTRLRLEGYKSRMQQEGFVPEVFLGRGDEAVSALIHHHHQNGSSMPTALLFVNDEHARQGVIELKQRGYAIPEDFSVIGFDDSENASLCKPPLTSVRVPRFLIGKLAGRTLLDHINIPDLDHAGIVLKTTLTVRESVRTVQ
jgi:LacI family transcriptional regulator